MLAQIRHPWLNTFFQVTGHPMLLSWGPHCNISTVVLDVMSQFAAAGDAPQGQQPPPGYAVAAPAAAAGRQYSAANPFGPGAGAAGGAPPPRPAPQLRKDSSARHTPLPPVPGSFPDLEGAPLTQLNRLLNDEVAFDAYFAAMEPVINFKALHRDLLKGNAELAQTCLAEGEAQGAQHAEVLALQAALRDLRDQHRGKLGAAGLGGDPRREHLGRAARARDRAEAASDARAAAFEDGSVSADQVDSFIEDFMDKRQRYHQLAAKLEHVQLTDVPR